MCSRRNSPLEQKTTAASTYCYDLNGFVQQPTQGTGEEAEFFKLPVLEIPQHRLGMQGKTGRFYASGDRVHLVHCESAAVCVSSRPPLPYSNLVSSSDGEMTLETRPPALYSR